VALLDNGRGFVLHLGMSGQILITSAVDDYELRTHDHVIFTMQTRARIVLNDARRFGMLFLVDAKNWTAHDAFKNMGPEPCGNEFSGPVLAARLKGRRTPIKTALLDQNVVAGVGNIYACEALHMAEISPLRIAADVQGGRAEALAESIRKVFLKAIDAGGSSLKDYHHTDGTLGYFQHQLLVYDRAGEPCPRCACREAARGVIKKSSKKPSQKAVLVKRIIQSGRSSFYCSNCQT
jgi:formamidopyrimidine-DNA glycosylase